MTAAHAPDPGPDPARGRRWRFRQWRRRRPFTGGVLLVLSGLELYLSGNTRLGSPGEFHLGTTGFLAYLIPAMLVLCGVLTLLSPQQRLFYGVLGILVAVYSLTAVNFGGFLAGVLLGIVGGALACAWVPVRRHPPVGSVVADGQPADSAAAYDGLDAAVAARPPASDERRTAWLLAPGDAPSAWPVGTGPGGTAGPGGPVAGPAAEQGDPPDDGADGQGTRWLAVVLAPLLTLAVAASNRACSPEAGATPSAGAGPTRSARAVAVPPLGPPPAPGDPGRWYEMEPGVVSVAPAVLKAQRLTMSGLSYDGVTGLSIRDGGTVRVLRFSMRRSVATSFRVSMPASGGQRLEMRGSSLTVSGHVVFYTGRFSGRLAGLVPVTFTPDSPPPVTLPEMLFTEVDLDLVYQTAGRLTAPDLTISYVS